MISNNTWKDQDYIRQGHDYIRWNHDHKEYIWNDQKHKWEDHEHQQDHKRIWKPVEHLWQPFVFCVYFINLVFIYFCHLYYSSCYFPCNIKRFLLHVAPTKKIEIIAIWIWKALVQKNTKEVFSQAIT